MSRRQAADVSRGGPDLEECEGTEAGERGSDFFFSIAYEYF